MESNPMEKQPEHKPEEFIGGEEVENDPSGLVGEKEGKKTQVKLESTESLVQSFNLFKEYFNPKSDIIYYPCSGSDISISKSFPGSKIIFLDQMDVVVDALKREGFEAIEGSAQDFKLETKADILLFYNPQIPPSEVMLANLSQKGYLLCNDYHQTASLIKKRQDFEFKGVIRKNKEGLIVDTENLEDYWREIDTDEEFKNAPLNWGSVNYGYAKKAVEKMTGKTENVIGEYKNLIKQAKEMVKKQNTKFLAENPNFPIAMIQDENSNPLMWNDENGEQHFIVTGFPKKKGTVDDTFVFQKI